MAGKTKTIILEEKLKEKEVEHYTDNLDVERLRVLKEIAETSYVSQSRSSAQLSCLLLSLFLCRLVCGRIVVLYCFD